MNQYINFVVWLLKISYATIAISVLAKLFGCPPPWYVYTFWTGIVIMGAISIIFSIICMLSDTSGCSGDCNQGRLPCNCKDEN